MYKNNKNNNNFYSKNEPISFSSPQKILYYSIFSTILLIFTIYIMDYLLFTIKPECIKTNGKIDRNKHFICSLGISFVIFIVFLLLFYQILT